METHERSPEEREREHECKECGNKREEDAEGEEWCWIVAVVSVRAEDGDEAHDTYKCDRSRCGGTKAQVTREFLRTVEVFVVLRRAGSPIG